MKTILSLMCLLLLSTVAYTRGRRETPAPTPPAPPAQQPQPVLTPQVAVPADSEHCDVYFWNECLEHNRDPRGQNGETWNGNRITVNQLYGLYPDNRNTSPPVNTSGASFFDSREDTMTHVEFYERGSGDTVIISRTDGIEEPYDEVRNVTDERNDYRVWIPLPDLEAQ